MENNVITDVTNLFSFFPKLRKFTNLTKKEYQTIWNTLAAYIKDQLLIEKSPEVPGLGIFYTIQSWNDRQKILIPQFFPSPKTFSRHPGYKNYKTLLEFKCRNRTKLNFTILSQMCKINREDFEMGLRDLQLFILHAVNKKLELSLILGKIGRLKISPEYIKMKFSVSILNELKDALIDLNESIEDINEINCDEKKEKKNKNNTENETENEIAIERINTNTNENLSQNNYNDNNKNNENRSNTKSIQEKSSNIKELDKTIENLTEMLKQEEEEFLPFDLLNRKDFYKLTENEKNKAITDLFKNFNGYKVQQNNYLKGPIPFHGTDNVFKPLIKQTHPYFLIKNNLKKINNQNNIFPNLKKNRFDPEVKKEDEIIKKVYDEIKPTAPHTHPYCGNRIWKSFNSCPICRQNKSVEIYTKKNDEKMEKELDLYLMRKAEKEKEEEEKYQKEIDFVRYKQAKEIAEFNKQIGEQKGSVFANRPQVKNPILENQKYTNELKEQIMNKEEERKKLKIAQELENRLYNKQFLYEFSKDQAEKHLHKLNVQQQQRDSLLFQIEKNRLEKLEKEKFDNYMFKKCSENLFARDEQPLFDLQKQKAIDLYHDQKLLERNKIMVNNKRQQKELQDDIDRLKFCQLLYKRDYNNEKRERTEIRKELESYWNEQIKKSDYDKRII
ncbi:hypothetical protein LY90DRAFT_509318 [Neocallimastix californiae]|uniref:CCDC81 HU domain-containing protein n=1 Tax=Neocallimastix californiae TaxID=1754190 RepID=A0A1Y2CGL7_9FUNG|nr:hypothetical protein LY90DRAFT_509318 [Neocallimastix californiae]|eukprot:ORY46169.1 hypothetical protein LY90DRAFT_509318 [Neocallimastix californiae]